MKIEKLGDTPRKESPADHATKRVERPRNSWPASPQSVFLAQFCRVAGRWNLRRDARWRRSAGRAHLLLTPAGQDRGVRAVFEIAKVPRLTWSRSVYESIHTPRIVHEAKSAGHIFFHYLTLVS